MDGPICDHQSDREEMSNSQRLAAVRRTIDRWFENRHPDADLEIRDSVLIRDGYYAGRKFQFGDYTAAWFIEEDELKIQDAEGEVLQRLIGAEIDKASELLTKAEEADPAVLKMFPARDIDRSNEAQRTQSQPKRRAA